MALTIVDSDLQRLDRLFAGVVEARTGEPFRGLDDCSWLDETEVDYKIAIHRSGREALGTSRWAGLLAKPGAISERVERAMRCAGNLVELRYGDKPFTGWTRAAGETRRAVERRTYELMAAAESGENAGRVELTGILDPWEDPSCSGPHLLPAEPALDFPGETFRVLKEKEEKQFGEYRARRLVPAAWARLERGEL